MNNFNDFGLVEWIVTLYVNHQLQSTVVVNLTLLAAVLSTTYNKYHWSQIQIFNLPVDEFDSQDFLHTMNIISIDCI